jgi:hypothetical protein
MKDAPRRSDGLKLFRGAQHIAHHLIRLPRLTKEPHIPWQSGFGSTKPDITMTFIQGQAFCTSLAKSSPFRKPGILTRR